MSDFAILNRKYLGVQFLNMSLIYRSAYAEELTGDTDRHESCQQNYDDASRFSFTFECKSKQLVSLAKSIDTSSQQYHDATLKLVHALI